MTFDAVQASKRHKSGFALRFPRIVRIRRDKPATEIDTVETVVRLMRKASTSTGLRNTVNVIRREYETGRKVADGFKANMTILFDKLLPRWNYVAKPQ